MNFENEITVEVATDLDNLIMLLEGNGFILKEEYDLNDIYMINKNDLSNDNLDMLSKSVLLRDIIMPDKEKRFITYKYKEFNDKKEITKNGKVRVAIDDINNAKEIFERLGFTELIKVNDHLLIYANETDEFAIQLVNNKHLYIEIEDKCNYAKRFYNSIDEMKDAIKKYNIPIKENNYFVKKAEIELMEKESIR